MAGTHFVVDCVETSWHGKCKRWEETCNKLRRDQILAGLDDVDTKFSACDLKAKVIEDMKIALRNRTQTVAFHCKSCDRLGYYEGGLITICNLTFSKGQNTVNAVVFHEMIHAIGGTELDAEAFENHCYRGEGATAPLGDDFEKFKAFRGNFVNWDRETGRVTLRNTGQELNVNPDDFIEPPPGGGGGWF